MSHSEPRTHNPPALPLLLLLVASVMGAAQVGLRIAWSHNWNYLFLIWNLVLAWLPVYFALHVRQRHQAGASDGSLCLPAGLWLLFLPNAPYIFTDLVHLQNWFAGHYWVDFSLVLQFGLTGFLLGFISLYLVHAVVRDRFGALAGWLFVLVSAGLCGIGVGLGRFGRWNSWDLVVHPFGLVNDIGRGAVHPLMHAKTLVFATLFASFLFVSYLMLYGLTLLQNESPRR